MKNSLFLLPLLALCGVAHADLTYTQITSSPFTAMMGGGGASGIKTKVYARGDASRTEAQMFGSTMITITHGSKNVMQLDPATKTYTTTNGGAAAVAKSMMPNGAKMPQMKMSVATKKLGSEKVNGVSAPHFRVDMNMQITTPRGPQSVKMGMDIWGSNVPYPVSAKTSSDALKNMPATFKQMFGGAVNISGDVKGMGAAYKTVPLRMTMSMNGRPISTINTTGISTKPVAASLFAVPAGYRAVSNAQFAQMQQAAMQKSMMKMRTRQ